MTTYCFDLDGTICTDSDGLYSFCKPILERVEQVRRLYQSGHTIIIHTARSRMREFVTLDQLSEWGVPYHHLVMGKPKADLYIDDKGVEADDFFSDSFGL